MSVTVKKVESKKDLKLFISFPNKLYKGNPYYVPALEPDDYNTFCKTRNASFEFCDADYFLAYKDGKLAGRIAALKNPRAIEAWGRNSSRFGWIDFIDDKEVSSALLETAEQWGRDHGCDCIEGPLGFTDFDTEGLLVEGFDRIGTLSTFYHFPYYKEHLEARGYKKETDWVEFRIPVPESIPEKYGRLSDLLSQKYNLTAKRLTRRQVNKMNIGQKLFNLVNQTYCDLYGYSQLSRSQIDQYVQLYLSMLDLDFISLIFNEKDELVAFGVVLPSLAVALQKAHGKYLPFGWYHLLKALLFKKTDTVDLLLIAVRRDLRNKGIPALIISDLFPRLKKYGFKWVETNPELEDNNKVQNLWNLFNPEQHKRRRVYGKEL